MAEGFEKENFQIANQPAVKLTFKEGFLIKGCWWITGGDLVDASENTEVIYLKHPKREVYLIFVIKYSSFDKVDASKTFYEMISTLEFKEVTSSEEDCNKIVKSLERDKCFCELAKSTRNENYCEKIETYIEAKDGCYQELAYFKDDYSLCEKIETENYLTSCKVYFEETPENWKVYTNSEANYQFDYPSEGVTFESETKEHVRFHWKELRSYGVYTHSNVKQTTLEEYVVQLDTGYPKWENLANYNKITVGERTAYQSKRGTPTYVFDGRNVYQLQCAGISSRESIDPIYDKMLSSFKFIEDQTADEETIKVSFPQGGEKLEIGKTYDIRWENYIANEPLTIALQVTLPDGETYLKRITENVPAASTGNYSWTVTSELADSKYRIEVYPEGDRLLVGRSKDFFSITGDSLIVVNTPQLLEEITSPIQITGQARKIFSEGEFIVKSKNMGPEWEVVESEAIASISGECDWMAGEWCNFTAELSFSKGERTSMRMLEFYRRSEQSGLSLVYSFLIYEK